MNADSNEVKVRHLVLAGIMVACVAACGGSGPDVSETRATPLIRTECDAAAANGSVFTTDVRPGMPFNFQLPRLPGWQMAPKESDGFVLRREDRLAGRLSSATLTLDVSRPRSVDDNTTVLSGMDGDWQQWRSEPVQVCGRGGNRSSGILPASGADTIDRYHVFLGFEYLAGKMLYPIQMVLEAPAADREVYQPDIETFIDGLQIVPIPPAG